MTLKKTYWKGEEELLRDPSFVQSSKNEFSEGLPLDEVLNDTDLELSATRRDFLKIFGFSISAVALAACNKTPIRKAVPYLVKPDDVTPGVANYYSSTCGYTGLPIEVKVREGRPIKIDGNPRSNVFKGGLSAVGHAGILELYDNERIQKPLKAGKISTWSDVDKDISTILANIKARNGKVAIVSGSINSPSTLAAINEFKIANPNTLHLTYDPISYHGIISANKVSFGKAVVPSYHFENADVVVGIEADFLGTWLLADKYTIDYASRRKPGKTMSRHIQVESVMSLTGSNADVRYPMQASNHGILLISIYNAIAKLLNEKELPVAKQTDLAGGGVQRIAKDLVNAKGKSLIVSGSNNPKHQIMVNAINLMLGNYNNAININNPINQYSGDDELFDAFITNLNEGMYDGVIFYNSNPVYTHPKSKQIADALKKVKLSISTSISLDETSELCQFVTPDNHYLESWNDHQQTAASYSFTQPTISPVFDTRQTQVSLLVWAGVVGNYSENKFKDSGINGEQHSTSPFYNFIKKTWNITDALFNTYLHEGVLEKEAVAPSTPALSINTSETASQIESESTKNEGLEIILIEKIGMLAGEMANNPQIQELPDPISKATWHNYVAISKAMAVQNAIEDNDVLEIIVKGIKIELPALIQPGQSNGTASIHLGYGRKTSGRVAKSRGVNVSQFIDVSNGFQNYFIKNASFKNTGKQYEIARTQSHHIVEGRDIVRETTLEEYNKDNKAGNKYHKPPVVSLWKDHDYQKPGAPNHLWGLAIDMNKCTGCGTCVISCNLENNVPVVGEVEVRRRREMHWLRIDRYFTFNNVKEINYKDALPGVAMDADYQGAKINKEKGLQAMDNILGKDGGYEHYENVSVIHQPMMCQHCGSAPCETVCPVLATTHSTEGLNQMTYNRCIGTKYCGNNCPYKVRRFNWFRYNDNSAFDFNFSNDLGKMVINPDVTVRTRGVMEKCSFCVQRIQAAKLTAKRENRAIVDGDVKTACQIACPSEAIIFGDINDPKSKIAEFFKDERSYSVLEELNVKPSVRYLTKVRNA